MNRLFPSSLVALALLAAAASASAGEKGQFPREADVFQQHLDARIARARAHIEERLQRKQVGGEEAKQAFAPTSASASRSSVSARASSGIRARRAGDSSSMLGIGASSPTTHGSSTV